MKIPFTLEAWLADKSQRVETRDGRPARIICTDAKADDGACVIALIPGYGGEEAYQFFPDGHAFSSKSSDEDCTDLFLITPEPEFSEFEKRLWEIMKSEGSPIGPIDKFTQDDARVFHAYSEQLLKLAREEIVKSGYAIVEGKHYLEEGRKNYERGKAEALKEIEQDPESSYAFKRGFEYGKEEALKDLPRWRKWGNGACGNSDGHPIALVSGAGGIRFVSALGVTDETYIMLDDLKKLPGFNEK